MTSSSQVLSIQQICAASVCSDDLIWKTLHNDCGITHFSGAPGVGRRTLIRKLLNSDTSHFAPVVQRESRAI